MHKTAALFAFLLLSALGFAEKSHDKPNVIIIITDDQGYGDLGIHGNALIKTPNLDTFAKDSVQLTRFYASPVCSPTRASLMTGRWNYRTGVVDTYLGRSMMHTEEFTLAEALRDAGYATGIFGKWHLGDNYPLRPQDQGFDEVLVHKGGGIGQPSDPPDNKYQDPVLHHNGKVKRYNGYCTDIFFDESLKFIEAQNGKPFFAYISMNAPHTPLEIAEENVQPYMELGLDEGTSKIYAMVENIDENVGKLENFLNEKSLDKNTILIFITDNGPSFFGGKTRYNGGMRDGKGSVYEGGIRVPCFVRWPQGLPSGKKIPHLAAHVDLYPTLLAMCDIPAPPGLPLDGINLAPWLVASEDTFPDRHVFLQWHRGDEPRPYENSAVITRDFKLVNGAELYNLANDPAEENNVADAHADKLAELRSAYDAWFADVSATRGYAPPRIHIGSKYENPVLLTPQDWRGEKAAWPATDAAHWELHVEENGVYRIIMDFVEQLPAGTATVTAVYEGKDSITVAKKYGDNDTKLRMDELNLIQGKMRLGFELESVPKGKGVRYVSVEKIR